MKPAVLIMIFFSLNLGAQQTISTVWVSDNRDGTYKNPVINADYSDPDVIRVGNDYYMVSSSFTHIPGLPILHSKDLVNWKIIGHALKKQPPYDVYDKVQHGAGVWAPSIRHHNNEFYIYYPDPDFGIYLIKSKDINGPWSEPVLVEAGKGLIDPCPLWDAGKTYLVHAYAGSRAGIKSIIVVKEMNTDGTKTIGNSVLVYDGHELDLTIEGPKFYKRNGYYYIFAPAGGVSTGWQPDDQAKRHAIEMSNADDAVKGDVREILVMDNFQKNYEIFTTPKIAGGHGGGDIRMQRRMFVDTNDNPHHIMAGTRDGAMSILIGIAARKSIKEKRPVKINELTDLVPMSNRF